LPIEPNEAQKKPDTGSPARTLGLIVAWAWAIVAGGGGFLLLLEKGPLPLTKCWFAMVSGISAYPLTAWTLKRFAGVTFSGRARLFTALLFFVAGRIALFVGV
jgi:hypothetical protein